MGKEGNQARQADPRMVRVQIGQITFKALVDSGASVNTVTPFIWEQLKNEARTHLQGVEYEPKETLKGYANEVPLNVNCSFTARVELCGNRQRSQIAKFFVVEGTELPLLSYETASSLSIIKIGLLDAQPLEYSLCSLELEGETQEQEFPKIPMEGARIRVKEEVAPRQIIRYNMPKAFEKAALERLEQMERRGIIERADKESDVITSVSPMVLVPKGAKDFRIVIDYREVNKRIEREPYPLPKLEKIWTEIPPLESNERLHLSVLDLADAFFHIELHESVRHLTTFMTANGLMRFRRLPFGLSIAPELFQKTMEKILCECKGTIVYLDDILIFGGTAEELRERTRAVKKELSRNNLTVNETKSKYEQDSVDFLGFTISGRGITPAQKKIVDIASFKRPETLSQLRSFLGLMTFISPFIKNFSHKTHPLRELLKAKEFKWTAEQTEAFEALKKAAEDEIVQRGYFNENDLIILYTDASPWGLGAVLVQESATTKQSRIIACTSKSLTETEKRYPQLHREALAIVWAMEKFNYYLLGRRFKLRSDSQALMFMTKHKQLKADTGKRILTRAEGWFMRLEHFDYDFEHVKGTSNIADTASRIAPSRNDEEFGIGREPHELCTVKARPKELFKRVLGLQAEELIAHTNGDEEIQVVLKCLTEERDLPPELRKYRAIERGLHVAGGLLLKEGRIVIPAALKRKALLWAHKTHKATPEMKCELRKAVWWFGLSKDVAEFVSKCGICEAIRLNEQQESERKEANFVAIVK